MCIWLSSSKSLLCGWTKLGTVPCNRKEVKITALLWSVDLTLLFTSNDMSSTNRVIFSKYRRSTCCNGNAFKISRKNNGYLQILWIGLMSKFDKWMCPFSKGGGGCWLALLLGCYWCCCFCFCCCSGVEHLLRKRSTIGCFMHRFDKQSSDWW